MSVSCDADADLCRAWRQFRDAHPLPYQTIAVSLEPSGDAVVIVSEPPPIAAPREVVDVVAALFGDGAGIKRLRFPVGHDGWLEDIVLRVKASNEAMVAVPAAAGDSISLPNSLADRLQYLSGVLYSTVDGFYVDRIAGQGQQTLRPLDKPALTDAHLQQLMQDASVTWSELGSASSAAMSWQDAMRVKKPTSLVDSSAAIVALVIPPRTDVRSMSGEFRRFAVSTDYLVGALGPKRGGVVLFGRNRLLALDAMPPLRFETLVSLSRTLGQPLGQSYERQRVFAGKIGAGPFESWDWAPIFLSPQLQDSELGMLLDLADQQLKSWSERGNIHYARFDISDPATFPFGNETASGWFLKNTGSLSLIFNWNTNGFGRATDGALGRTVSAASLTALPVSYIPPSPDESVLQKLLSDNFKSDLMASAEEASKIGTQYFSELGDPILARVARNIFLYQILSATQPFQMPKAPEATETERSLAVSRILTSEVNRWLAQAVSPGPGHIPTVAKAVGELGMSLPRLAELIAAPQSNTRAIVSAQTTWRNKLTELQEVGIQNLVKRQELEELAQQAETAFIAECASAHGELLQERFRLRCKLEAPLGMHHELAVFEKMRFARAKSEADALESRFGRCRETLTSTARTLQRLSHERKIAERIAEELRERSSMDADLAAVLERVLIATRGTASQSSIQTPSVVLSCNGVNQAMVGGHNIDPIPGLLGDPLPRGAIAGLKPAAARPLRGASPLFGAKPAEPVRPIAQALGLPPGRRTGSFLERLQTRADVQPVERSAVLERARLGNCDVYVERGDAGTATIVRLGPPPVLETVFGSSPLVQQLSQTKPSARVLFAGFGTERARALTLSAAQRAKATAGTARPVEGSVRSARTLFRNAVERAQTVLKLKSYGAKSTAVVSDAGVSRERLAKILDTQPPWKNASITKAGDGGALIEVVFPSDSIEFSKLEVQAFGAEGTTLRSPQLSDLADGTLRMTLRLNPRVQQVVDRLGERLLRERDVHHVEFFFKDVGRIVRLQKILGHVYAQVTIVR